jgi:hypothetical protein
MEGLLSTADCDFFSMLFHESDSASRSRSRCFTIGEFRSRPEHFVSPVANHFTNSQPGFAISRHFAGIARGLCCPDEPVTTARALPYVCNNFVITHFIVNRNRPKSLLRLVPERKSLNRNMLNIIIVYLSSCSRFFLAVPFCAIWHGGFGTILELETRSSSV